MFGSPKTELKKITKQNKKTVRFPLQRFANARMLRVVVFAIAVYSGEKK